MEPEQVTFVKSIPADMATQLGLSSAIAFDYKLPLTLDIPQEQTARIRICKGVSAGATFHADWSEGSSPVIKNWNVTIGIGF